MKKFLLPGLLFFSIGICIAQPGEWVWIHGPNTVNDAGTFGVQGVSNPSNNPPSVYESCEWTDQNGNFWLYGGLNWNFQEMGDLWKYNPSINEWTWMTGTGIFGSVANYGTIGVPSPANSPGSRSWGVATWVDNQGNFWLFGGLKTGDVFADLWRYEPSTNNWTWMKGPQGAGSSGVYGTQGVPSPSNFPACRYETAATWTDNAGDLWLFGGYNMSASRNDLWRYNIASNEWTWMKGSQFTGAPNVYGSQGIEDPANTPSCRAIYSHWKDLNENFWLYSGVDFQGSTYDDLWRYNPSTNNWAWIKGTTTSGIYGTKCVADTMNTPGARMEDRAVATIAGDNLWLFGGMQASGMINDLWMYCIPTNSWIWVSGDSVASSTGVWGSLGVSSPLNKPDGRGGTVMWSDQNGHLYVFGGTTDPWISTHNDLWKFTIDPACANCSSQPIAMFNAPNQICPGTCTDFNNTSLGSTSYQWSFPGGNPAVSTDMNPTNICYNTTGSYDVTLIAFNGANSDTLMLSNFITVFPTPPPQGITRSGDTLFANQGATSYQWYHDGVLVPGATDYFYVAPVSGNYNVVATDANNCEVEAVIFDVIASNSELKLLNWQLAIYPNPAKGILEIRNLKAGSNISVIVYNNRGEKVFDEKKKNVDENISIDVSTFSSGAYVIEIADGKTSARKIFTKE